MSRNYELYLGDIREACAKVQRYVGDLDRDAFFADEKTVDAVLRNLEIIGEAAKQVPEEVRSRYPAVEWRNIAGFRDIVVHRYFNLDDDIIWDVVQNKVPELETHLGGAEGSGP
jgi:uncharacterized protein with HEPN domain